MLNKGLKEPPDENSNSMTVFGYTTVLVLIEGMRRIFLVLCGILGMYGIDLFVLRAHKYGLEYQIDQLSKFIPSMIFSTFQQV